MNTVWTVLLPLATKGPDPADVGAGGLAFVVFLALAVAVVFLAFSLRKHLKKVDFDDGDDPANGDAAGTSDSPPDSTHGSPRGD